ncbi:MAG: hypothetical protein LBP72_10830 [Dysgonamonadaceae bacterium]|jgi:hypothetical protein|nr:hypothetical protein [Dysgonamonadaceae bacterium]
MKLITYNKISRRKNTLLSGCFSLRFVVQRSPSTELRSSSIAIELLRSSGGAEGFAPPHCASLVRGYPNLTPVGVRGKNNRSIQI